jgi:hypothetical protein
MKMEVSDVLDYNGSYSDCRFKAVRAAYDMGYLTYDEAKRFLEPQLVVIRNECTDILLVEYIDIITITCTEQTSFTQYETIFDLTYDKSSDTIICR